MTAKADSLRIHNRLVELIKIPDGADISKIDDPKLIPKNVTNFTKIYFSAHGNETLNKYVMDKRSEDAHIYRVNDVAAYLANILRDAMFKDPHLTPRLTLVMSVCEGVSFAKNLQKKLFDQYGIFIDVIANRFVIHEQYEHHPTENSLNIPYRFTSVHGSRDRAHQRPHSKVLISIDENGRQTETDAYELKWILTVANKIEKRLQSFLRWADFSNEENMAIANGIKKVCHDIRLIIKKNLEHSVNNTANILLALLMSCVKAEADPAYRDAMKYFLLNTTIMELIKSGKHHVNIHSEMLKHLETTDAREKDTPRSDEAELINNLIRAANAKFSKLLKEAGKHQDTSLLEDVEITKKQLEDLKKYRDTRK